MLLLLVMPKCGKCILAWNEVPGKFSWLSFLLKIYIGRNGYSCVCVCVCLSDSRIIFKQRSVNHSITTFLKYTGILSGWNRSTQLNS